MQSLTEAKPGDVYTIKWLLGNPGVVEWMDGRQVRQGSRVEVIQNSMGHLIIGVEGRRLAIGPEAARRIKI